LVPRDLSPSDPAVSEIGRTAKLEEIGYRFTDGILGIVELSVIYMHDAHRWSVSVQASGPMKVDDILELPLAKEVIDFVTARIFDRLGAS